MSVSAFAARCGQYFLLHLVSIREDLKFAAVVVTLEGDTVGERANGSALVFPAEVN